MTTPIEEAVYLDIKFDEQSNYGIEFVEQDTFDIEVNSAEEFDLSFEEAEYVDLSFDECSSDFDVQFEAIEISAEHGIYGGPYNVMPKVYQQGLDTDKKLMDANVTVFAIPKDVTTNVAGGYTVVIGGR